MRTLGIRLGNITSGQVEIVVVPEPEVSQQHGFVHAAAISAIADSAAGHAALGRMPMGHCSLIEACVIETMPATASVI